MNRLSRVRIAGVSCVLVALTGAATAQAHNWGCWRQPNRTVPAYVTAVLSSQANAAVSEWDTRTILSVPRVGSHTEISVFDGFYGNTGWAGIASIESASGCNILHGHARVNRTYSYTSNGYRGIFCQEVGHLFGLDHSNDGGCMGGGYFYSINTYYTLAQHNITDIANKYASAPAGVAPEDEIASASHEDHGGLHDGGIPEGTTRAMAFWHDRPSTLDEAVERSQAVITGRVLHIVAGPDIVVPVNGLKDGVDRIPTQRILVAVEGVLAGRLKTRVIELFRTGNDTFTLGEDPSYGVGERYVLFLTPADRGAFRVIAPEGRLEITDAGLVPVSTREFMSDLRGRTVEALSSDLARLAPVPDSDGSPGLAGGLQLRRDGVNPFKSQTSISYLLPQTSNVQLLIFDAQGRVVRSLVDAEQQGQQWHTIEWDGRDDLGQSVANGVYFARLLTSSGMRSISIVRLQ